MLISCFISEGSGLADGRWHTVRAEVANNYVKLMVNGKIDPLQKNLNIRTGSDYFIGGSSKIYKMLFVTIKA